MVTHMTTKATTWIRRHIIAVAAAGALILGGSGVVAAATLPHIVTPTTEATADPDSSSSSKPITLTGDTDTADEQTNDPTEPAPGSNDEPNDPTNPGASDNPPAAAPPAAAPPAEEPAPEEPPAPPATPGPVTGVSVSSDGAGGFYVTWGTPDMRGATLDHYWVDIVDPGYTTGDRITPIYGNSISGNATPGTNCAVVAAVSTDGIQGEVSGPYCW